MKMRRIRRNCVRVIQSVSIFYNCDGLSQNENAVKPLPHGKAMVSTLPPKRVLHVYGRVPDLQSLGGMTRVLVWVPICTILLTIQSGPAWAKRNNCHERHTASVPSEDGEPSLGEMQRDLRLQNAQELLGKYYCGSVVRSGEKVQRINNEIYVWTKERLPKRFKKDYKKIAQAIIDESYKHDFDPVFILSVIQNESRFNPVRRGALDEIGLMQLRPGTAKWIAQKYGITYHGKKSLRDPIENIVLGTAYMDYLHDRFDSHARLYLSAYNMGAKSVDEDLKKNYWPREYAQHVMRLYVDFYTTLKTNRKTTTI